jgi:hypothetical protein
MIGKKESVAGKNATAIPARLVNAILDRVPGKCSKHLNRYFGPSHAFFL